MLTGQGFQVLVETQVQDGHTDQAEGSEPQTQGAGGGTLTGQGPQSGDPGCRRGHADWERSSEPQRRLTVQEAVLRTQHHSAGQKNY